MANRVRCDVEHDMKRLGEADIDGKIGKRLGFDGSGRVKRR